MKQAGKKRKKKTSQQSKWIPPKGASAYFCASSDYEFKAKHPIGYFFLVLLGIVALLAPVILYTVYVIPTFGNEWQWPYILGFVGSFVIGIGLFNFVAIIIKQYLGHLVSILSFLIGGILVAISIWML